MQNKRFLIIISQFFSLFGFYPAVYFITFILKLSLAALDINPAGTAAVQESMMENLQTSIHIRLSLVFFLISAVSNFAISFLIRKKARSDKFLRRYSIFICFYGGALSSSLYLLVHYLRKYVFHKNISKNKAPNYRGSRTKVLSLLSAFILLIPASFGVFAFNYKSAEGVARVNNVYLSPSSIKPNVLEIFTDGLDIDYVKNAMSDEHYEEMSDFISFDRAVSGGYKTYTGLWPTLMGQDYNAIRIRKENLDPAIRHKMTVNKFANSTKTIYDHEYILNLHGLSEQSSFANDWTGEPNYVKKYYPKAETVNWKGAKEGISNFWGTTKSADNMFYEFFSKTVNSETDKPSYVFLQDSLSHVPIVSDANGDFVASGSTTAEIYKNIFNNYLKIIRSLKKNKVYDNTMIIIYGDHADHRYGDPKLKPNLELKKNRSVMMMKPPHYNSGLPRMEWRKEPLYIPFTKSIAMDYVNRFPDPSKVKSKIDIDAWIKNNPNIDENRRYMSLLTVFTATISHFEGNKLIYDHILKTNNDDWKKYIIWKDYNEKI